jgi:cytoskeletal protein CcmA (bactofilin family)
VVAFLRGALHKRSGSSPPVHTSEFKDFQSKLTVIIGEVHFKGVMPVDGSIAGRIGSGSDLAVKQRTSIVLQSQPELTGNLSFKDMVRVNGHIAGAVSSKTGTLIVATSAVVEADINVAVAVISGTVRGEIVARERVNLDQPQRFMATSGLAQLLSRTAPCLRASAA